LAVHSFYRAVSEDSEYTTNRDTHLAPMKKEGGTKEPQVNFDAQTGELVLGGRSIPENSFELYKPLLSWVEAYVAQPAKATRFEFRLSYFNSSSAEYILDLYRLLQKLTEAGHALECQWYYDADDEDMLQVAEDFQNMVGIPIELIVNEEEEPGVA
jgi:hypothetical protein